MTIIDLRKYIKQLITTFKISKDSTVIITAGDQHFKIKSVHAVADKGMPHINIEIIQKGEE